jgi:glycosyltransferase involved in cell wall biosynthesis
MRLALVYRSFSLGASLSRMNVELARYLASSGHDVNVYSAASMTERELAPDCTFHNVPVKAVATGSGPSARELRSFARAAASMLGNTTYDIIHTRAPSTWVADVLHLPGVQQGESELGGYSTARWRAARLRHPGNQARYAIERRAIRNPQVMRFHTDAPIVRDHLIDFYGIDEARIRVMTPGINVEEFCPGDQLEARRAVGLPADGRPLVLFCGHDFQRKGLDRAIHATASSRTRFELVVVGGNADQPLFENLALEAGIRDRVHFVGAAADAAQFHRAADAFVLPTRVDIWGMTVVEAMACGVVPVVSDAAGASAAVDDGMTGFVLPEPLDVQRLTDTLDRIVSEPDLRRTMAVRCRDAALHHTWHEHGRRVERDLEEIVARGSRGHSVPSM